MLILYSIVKSELLALFRTAECSMVIYEQIILQTQSSE